MVNARGLDEAGNYLAALSGPEWDMDAVKRSRLIDAAPRLYAFAQLISDFCSHDSAGHMIYLKKQADNVLRLAREGRPRR